MSENKCLFYTLNKVRMEKCYPSSNPPRLRQRHTRASFLPYSIFFTDE